MVPETSLHYLLAAGFLPIMEPTLSTYLYTLDNDHDEQISNEAVRHYFYLSKVATAEDLQTEKCSRSSSLVANFVGLS